VTIETLFRTPRHRAETPPGERAAVPKLNEAERPWSAFVQLVDGIERFVATVVATDREKK
jgi:hypothetical protein